MATGVAADDGFHAGQSLEDGFSTPKATAGKRGEFRGIGRLSHRFGGFGGGQRERADQQQQG